jgi:hypothetical protein
LASIHIVDLQEILESQIKEVGVILSSATHGITKAPNPPTLTIPYETTLEECLALSEEEIVFDDFE